MNIQWFLFLEITLLFQFYTAQTMKESEDWFKIAKEDLLTALKNQRNVNKAKNVILYVGTGMGTSTITAARILRGQQNGQSGEETILAFEKFPNTALIKTYAVDLQVPEAGATQTAMLCGIKTNARLLGLRETAKFNVCTSQFGAEVPCILEWFNQQGRSVGIVTDGRVTEAIVSAGYAKSANRLWEGDSAQSTQDIKDGCVDIAKQLVTRNPFIKVIFGGGRKFFLTNNTLDPENSKEFQIDQRRDGNDLTRIWLKEKRERNARAKYVWNNMQFNRINPEKTDFALGLFSPDGMASEVDRDKSPRGEPSLSEMTKKAINILKRNRKGFFLTVVGDNIDSEHHSNKAKRALIQTLQLEESVKVGLSLTDKEDTLILVAPNHAQMLKIAGFSNRGNDILGVAGMGPGRTPDGLPWTTLVYGNGPGYDFGKRVNVSAIDTSGNEFMQASAVPVNPNTHSGEDVPLYANGPWSHLFHSTHEQNYIAHVMAFAACVGPYESRCARRVNSD